MYDHNCEIQKPVKHTRTVLHGAVESIDCEKVKEGKDWMGFAGKLLISENISWQTHEKTSR